MFTYTVDKLYLFRSVFTNTFYNLQLKLYFFNIRTNVKFVTKSFIFLCTSWKRKYYGYCLKHFSYENKLLSINYSFNKNIFSEN